MAVFTRPSGLNHVAWVTWNTQETVRFYTEVLGMRLVSHALAEQVGSSGEQTRFLHTFFEMGDGSCIAFFEVEGVPRVQPEAAISSWVRHIALSVDSEAELLDAKQRLEDKGVEVRGVVDHEGIWKSIYFFDPNGVRLELTHQRVPLDDEHAHAAQKVVEEWNKTCEAAAV